MQFDSGASSIIDINETEIFNNLSSINVNSDIPAYQHIRHFLNVFDGFSLPNVSPWFCVFARASADRDRG
jgi:hypothetical protein